MGEAGESGGAFTFNLMLPDMTKFASYVFDPLTGYAQANGTPILNPALLFLPHFVPLCATT